MDAVVWNKVDSDTTRIIAAVYAAPSVDFSNIGTYVMDYANNSSDVTLTAGVLDKYYRRIYGH